MSKKTGVTFIYHKDALRARVSAGETQDSVVASLAKELADGIAKRLSDTKPQDEAKH